MLGLRHRHRDGWACGDQCDVLAESPVGPVQQGITRVVGDLHQPAGEVEQHGQQPDTRGQQPEDLIVGSERGNTDDPDGADDRGRHRSHTTDHHHGDEAQGDVDDEEAPGSAERHVGIGATQQRATHASQRPRNGEGADLLPDRPDPVSGRGVLVVAHRHDGPPDAAVPEPVGDQEHHRQNDEDDVVVGALTREGE